MDCTGNHTFPLNAKTAFCFFGHDIIITLCGRSITLVGAIIKLLTFFTEIKFLGISKIQKIEALKKVFYTKDINIHL